MPDRVSDPRESAEGLDRAFDSRPEEESYLIDSIDGVVPPFVRGAYYINGPAGFSRGDFRYRHWLDGDGMVCALHFADEGVRFTGRFVRSTKYVTEESEGRPVFRAFGTAFSGDRLNRGIMLESPVNVNVVCYGDHVLALGEQGLPWELDPSTLETIGRYDFGGYLRDVTPFSAHASVDQLTGDLFNFGVSFSESRPCLNVYRFAKDGGCVYRKRLPLEYCASIHDAKLSERYHVFFVSPYVMDMTSFVTEGRSVMDSLSWAPERGASLLVASRETGEQVLSVPVDSAYCLHLINCFDQNDSLVVDAILYERPIYDQYEPLPELFSSVPPARPVRFEVDTRSGQVTRRTELEHRDASDFPSVDPRLSGLPYSDFWMLSLSRTGQPGRKFFDQLVHAGWDAGGVKGVYSAAPRHYFCGEPVFVPDPEDKRTGVVITQVFDAETARSGFVLFDAFDVSRGPVATLHLKSRMHLGFHATYRAE